LEGEVITRLVLFGFETQVFGMVHMLGNCIFAKRLGGLPNPLYMARLARPQVGEVAFLELELKLIADIGLVGFPNAGKSSLLRAMSAATPEVAAYPFTTLHPMIGCIEYRDGFRVKAADIPGLIDGASEGRGKGHSFLKHVERTKALLYVVDSASVDFRDPLVDLRTLAKELASYGDGSLMDRRVLVVGNKVDLLHKDHAVELQESLKDTGNDIGLLLDHDPMMISAGVSGHGLQDLSKAIRHIVQKSHAEGNETVRTEA
jgi:Obg family GTPase CgtA